MNLKQAIEILDYHQSWRLGKTDEMIYEPKKITQALDIILDEVKKLHLAVKVRCDCKENEVCYYCEFEKTGTKILTTPNY